jgi:hypothetical protein
MTMHISSAGPITFSPDGVLFLADNAGARIIAAEISEDAVPGFSGGFNAADVNASVASLLGTELDGVAIRDLAVHPVSKNIFLSIQRGTGDAGEAVLVRIDRADGSYSAVSLDDLTVTESSIADAPAVTDERLDTLLPTNDEGEVMTFGDHSIRILRQPIRTSTITDLAFVDGDLLVAGLSNEEFSSKLRRIPFPFSEASETTDNNLEIYHVSHGKWETASPIRRFVPYDVGRSILASYTCTPVVVFSLADVVPGTKTIGRTVADLGNMNQPLGMVAFSRDGEEHLLVSNSAHGLLKISRSDIDGQEALTEPREPLGIPRQDENIAGVSFLANLDDDYILALQTDDDGRQQLRSLETASL